MRHGVMNMNLSILYAIELWIDKKELSLAVQQFPSASKENCNCQHSSFNELIFTVIFSKARKRAYWIQTIECYIGSVNSNAI